MSLEEDERVEDDDAEDELETEDAEEGAVDDVVAIDADEDAVENGWLNEWLEFVWDAGIVEANKESSETNIFLTSRREAGLSGRGGGPLVVVLSDGELKWREICGRASSNAAEGDEGRGGKGGGAGSDDNDGWMGRRLIVDDEELFVV